MSRVPEVEEYPEILEALYKFINNYNDEDNNLVDVVMEFCFLNSYPPELIADVVSGDSSFKLAVEINCTANKVFRTKKLQASETPPIDAWED